MGYWRAGFDVIGVDVKPQPNYPFPFVQADALNPPFELTQFDAVHASPPCQAYSTISRGDKDYPDLYEPTRAMLQAARVPYVIENVIGAPYRSGFVLCGSMFGLEVRRHRNFETSFAVLAPSCEHKAQGRPWTITGHGGGHESKHSRKPSPRDFWRYMEMPWATPYGCTQAVPPAFTEWIGSRLVDHLAEVAA